MALPKPKAQLRYHVALAGVDTLKVSARGQLRQDAVDLLEALQQQAIAERDQRLYKGEAAVDTHWTLNGEPLLMRAHGGGKDYGSTSSPALRRPSSSV